MSESVLILDRDGVINYDSEEYIKSPAEWQPIPGSLAAMANLYQSGWRIVVVSNQSGLGRGLFDMETLHAIHQRMLTLLREMGGKIEAIFFCPHTPTDSCDCRKPKTGLYRMAAERLGISLEDVPCVGDKISDMNAAIAVGGRPLLVRTGYGEKTLAARLPAEISVYANLAAVATALQEG